MSALGLYSPAVAKLRALELAVLGLAWKSGPCTPYAIRQHFIESPSSHWSGSAGAIYPLITRLERRGLLRSRDGTRGARPGRAYSLTPRGLAHLQEWLSAPLPLEDVSVTFDPIRTRLLFLGAVPPARRRRLLHDARAKLGAEVKEARELHARHSRGTDRFEALASLGALLVMQARLRWLTRVAGALAVQREGRARSGPRRSRRSRLA
jgi:DNA-binding PadR family transcriptional regulator